jgi:hypothetical protein
MDRELDSHTFGRGEHQLSNHAKLDHCDDSVNNVIQLIRH